MRIVKAKSTLWNEELSPVQKIEKVARICYKSEDKITSDSANRMVKSLIKNKHFAMLEHSSLCVEVSNKTYEYWKGIQRIMEDNGVKTYLRFTHVNRWLVSGNIRAWRDALHFVSDCIPESLYKILISDTYYILFVDVLYDMGVSNENQSVYTLVDTSTLSGIEADVHRDVTAHFICDRGVSHEIVRHRPCSFAQESTRYCNYSNDKFGRELTIIEPLFFVVNDNEYQIWKQLCMQSEEAYFKLLDNGAKPQEARDVLPQSVKTEIVVTCNLGEWKHFFALRACGATGMPHPQMLEVSIPLLSEFKSYIPNTFDNYKVPDNYLEVISYDAH